MSFRKIAVIIAVLFMTAMLIIYPENCLESARSGLELWAKNVLPSLLPFVVASFILLETGIVSLISGLLAPLMRLFFNAPGESAYVLLASSLSGYPVGARLTDELFKKNTISIDEAQKILRFTSVSGPVFITGAVSAGMLRLPEAGVYLAATHYLSAVLVGVVFGLVLKRNKDQKKKYSIRESIKEFKKDIMCLKPFGDILTDSVSKAVSTMLKIGGFIVFFSVVTEILSVVGIIDFLAELLTPAAELLGFSEAAVRSLLTGSVELTNGCAYAASNITEPGVKLSLISFLLAFGGMSVHMQTRAVCRSVKPKLFFLAKLLQGVIAYISCMLALKAFPLSVKASSIGAQTKTAAYFGYIFAAVTILILVIIKFAQTERLRRDA